MKKLLCTLVALALLLPAGTAALAANELPLISPAPAAWYDADLSWAREGALLPADAAPGAPLTRAVFFDALYRYAIAEKVDVSAGEDTNILSFDDAFDLAEGYCSCFQWACAAGLIDGSAVTALRPNDPMTREEAVVLLFAFAKTVKVDVSVLEDTNILSFDDVLDLAEGHFEAFQWACGAGIVLGTGAATLSPGMTATNAQLAAMLARFDRGCVIPA